MTFLTAEQIAQQTENLVGLAERREINKLFRLQDESTLYPVLGRFDVTERAIQRVRRYEQSNGALAGLEYCLALQDEIGDLVNGFL